MEVFLRRENRGWKLTMLFAKVFVSLFFIHFQCGQIIRMGVNFFQFCKIKDPVCSEFTAKQYMYLGVDFAFTYSVSAFITVSNHDLQDFFVFFFLLTSLYVHSLHPTVISSTTSYTRQPV